VEARTYWGASAGESAASSAALVVLCLPPIYAVYGSSSDVCGCRARFLLLFLLACLSCRMPCQERSQTDSSGLLPEACRFSLEDVCYVFFYALSVYQACAYC